MKGCEPELDRPCHARTRRAATEGASQASSKAVQTEGNQAKRRLGEGPAICASRSTNAFVRGADRAMVILVHGAEQRSGSPVRGRLSAVGIGRYQLAAAALQRRIAREADVGRPAPVSINPPYSGGRDCAVRGEVPLQGSKGSVDPK